MIAKINIPQNHQDFCKAIAKLCREHGMTRAILTYLPGWKDAWHADVRMTWEQGRHGDAAGEIYIASTVDVRTKIDEPPASQPTDQASGAQPAAPSIMPTDGGSAV